MRFHQRRAVVDEGHGDVVRAGGERDPHLEILVQGGVVVDDLLNREGRHQLAVHQHDHFVLAAPLTQSTDVPVQIAREPHLNLVLAIPRERVRDRHSAARAKRKPGDVRFLRAIGRQPNRIGLQRRLNAANREAAYFLRSGDVAIEKRRGEVTDGHVVETMTALVGRQQRVDVDVERQEIADSVAIFRSIEAAQRLGPAGVWLFRRGGIERAFEPRHQRLPIRGRQAAACWAAASCRCALCAPPFPRPPCWRQGSATSARSSIRPAVFTRSL